VEWQNAQGGISSREQKNNGEEKRRETAQTFRLGERITGGGGGLSGEG